MNVKTIDAPVFGEPLEAAHGNPAFLEVLLRRRSTTAAMLGGPGPSDAELALILRVGARVPDHRRVTPFRFIIFKGDARVRFGDELRKAYAAENPECDGKALELEAGRFLRAPLVVGVVSNIYPEHKTPGWEQILCAGAVCQSLLFAASASGFAAQWLTEWYSFDKSIAHFLQLTENERIAGFIYIGTAIEPPRERARPVMDEIISYF